jgi:hypothetical protein
MADIQRPFPRKAAKGPHAITASAKRKSFESRDTENAATAAVNKNNNTAQKKRKLDQIEHVPTLISSTFNPLEEVDFPRGGAVLTPLERKQAEIEGIQDALFQVYTE